MDTHRIGTEHDSGTAFARLPERLPKGRLLDRDSLPARGDGAVMWLSDRPVADAGVWWGSLRRGHAASGLWPLLVGGPRAGPFRPWRTGELAPSTVEAVDASDPAEVLGRLWPGPGAQRGGGQAAGAAGVVPADFPGLAGRVVRGRSPDVVAEECALVLAVWRRPRLGLVAAARGADAPALCGWPGAGRHTDDLAGLCAVLRSWEERFGARVVGLGHDSLDVAVARPPTNPAVALPVAAEHYAFCPGNLHPLDGRPSGPDLKCYALDLIHRRRWHFWWD